MYNELDFSTLQGKTLTEITGCAARSRPPSCAKRKGSEMAVTDDDLRDRCSTCDIDFEYDGWPCHSCAVRNDFQVNAGGEGFKSYWVARPYIAELIAYRSEKVQQQNEIGDAPMLGGDRRK